ncbi:Acetyltransferase (GNAT) family protein [Kushneria avicenniae]|uniref:Acetyltransferase (GNAT) family protein n=1 Tax=Kushneria avicenniae TaxID=402385 RepID=A0A1I1JRJ9_9GAMM|nr:GNAT family N-acetyltransferase [Kushneria avicenniae]SFC48493.1 Acetyltransferase (GNAT) family protein [Kushneria avicenniae]
MLIKIIALHERPGFTDACSAWAYGQWGVHSPRTLEETRLLFASAAHGCGLPLTWVAQYGDHPVGMASLVDNDCSKRPNLRPWLAAVFVHPDYRGRGIAARLIKTVETAALALGEARLYLITANQQTLYERYGWQKMGVVAYPERPCILMEKHILEAGVPA